MARFRGTLDTAGGTSCARLDDDGLTVCAGGWEGRIVVEVSLCPKTGRDRYTVSWVEGHKGRKMLVQLIAGYLDTPPEDAAKAVSTS